MALGIATVGRRKFATDLVWQVSPSGQVVNAAKEAAKQADAEYTSIRLGTKSGRLPQFGLGTERQGHSLGMPALAATVANRLPGSWAGAFKVREGTYFISVRDDLIMPEGDMLFADEVEARQRLLQEINAGGLQRIYAPEPWSIPGSEGMSLVLLLQDKAESPLRPVKVSKKTLFRGVALAVLAGALLIGGLWWQQMEEARHQKEQEQLAAAERARQQAMGQLPSQLQGSQIAYPPPIRFWEQEPQPLALIAACRRAFEQVQEHPKGWALSNATCSKAALAVSWAAVTRFSDMIPEAVTSIDGATASHSIEIKDVAPRGQEDLFDPEAITKRYINENWAGTIFRAPDDPLPSRPAEVPEDKWNPPPAPWVKRGFKVTVPSLPGEAKTYFDALPGVIITSLTYNGGNWSIEGVIYENRK